METQTQKEKKNPDGIPESMEHDGREPARALGSPG